MKVTTVYHVKVKDIQKIVLWEIALIGECHLRLFRKVLEQCVLDPRERETIQRIVTWCGLAKRSGTTTSCFGCVEIKELQGWEDTNN